jgi:hypothetical protein
MAPAGVALFLVSINAMEDLSNLIRETNSHLAHIAGTLDRMCDTLNDSAVTQRDILTELREVEVAVGSVASDIMGDTGSTLSDLDTKLDEVAAEVTGAPGYTLNDLQAKLDEVASEITGVTGSTLSDLHAKLEEIAEA